MAGKLNDCDQTSQIWKSSILLVSVVVAEHFRILVMQIKKMI